MGILKNWLICGDVDGVDHKERTEFRKKFPYTNIKGILGGDDANKTHLSIPSDSMSEHSAMQKLPLEAARAMRAIQAAASRTSSEVNQLRSGCDWQWQLINNETGQKENVKIKLAIPNNIEIPDIDMPQFPANRIRPIRNLVNRFIPYWYNDDGTKKDKPHGTDFAKARALSLYGKTFTFNVIGVGERPSGLSWPHYDVLLVWSYELEELIMRSIVEFRKELDAVKSSFASMKAAEESFLAIGAKLPGRILIQGYDCSQVELDGVNLYSSRLHNGDKVMLLNKNIAEAAKKVCEFIVESIDEKNLTVVVSSPETKELIEMAHHEDKKLVRDAAMSSLKIGVLEDKPLLIDGSNVVRCCRRHGWRGLKTLLDWLKRNEVDYFLYFDASITYVEMDAAGKAFIKAQIEDSTHVSMCPSRDEADKFILFRADKTGSHVLSNDGYKVWETEYPWIYVENHTGIRRVHKFMEDNWDGVECFVVGDLGVCEKIVDVD